MNDATLTRLMMERGPEFPPVARALAELDDTHPLKVQANEMAAAAAAAPDSVVETSVEDRLADIESRVAELEGQ